MKKVFCIAALLSAFVAAAQEGRDDEDFSRHFTGETLRLDYVFCGDASHQAIYWEEALRTGVWAGRRTHLGEPMLRGNGQIRLLDPSSGEVLYINSFSTLFQEWVTYEEATRVQRAFENCFQVPFPKHPVEVEICLTDHHGAVSARLRHRIDPEDILIRELHDSGLHAEVLHQGGTVEEAIDLVILADGYTEGEESKFFADADRARRALLAHEPFRSHAGRFSFRAVFAPSAESGASVPHEGLWRNTVADSHFDTFYSDRYLTSSSLRKIYDLAGTVPFEHIILLINTPVYGGGGIFNAITYMGSDHPTFNQVLVHEFGHAFAGLGDEYFYDDMFENPYPADVEPWEPNLTTLVDFGSKWQDMLPPGTAVPTPVDALEQQDVRSRWKTFTNEQKALLNSKVGVYEGGGYTSKGVYRPVQECRMKINECEEFCPVCTRAILRAIYY